MLCNWRHLLAAVFLCLRPRGGGGFLKGVILGGWFFFFFVYFCRACRARRCIRFFIFLLRNYKRSVMMMGETNLVRAGCESHSVLSPPTPQLSYVRYVWAKCEMEPCQEMV